jgi:hypothetical protein
LPEATQRRPRLRERTRQLGRHDAPVGFTYEQVMPDGEPQPFRAVLEEGLAAGVEDPDARRFHHR